MQQHFGKKDGVQKSNISRMQNCIDKVKQKMLSEKQSIVKITKDDVKINLKSMPDWKGAGPDKSRVFG